MVIGQRCAVRSEVCSEVRGGCAVRSGWVCSEVRGGCAVRSEVGVQ